MSKKNVVKAGRLLQLESGQYSDYRVLGFYVALQDFNPFEELEAYLKEKPDQREDCSFQKDEWIAFVIARGYLLEIEPDVFDMGGYGCAEFKLSGPE